LFIYLFNIIFTSLLLFIKRIIWNSNNKKVWYRDQHVNRIGMILVSITCALESRMGRKTKMKCACAGVVGGRMTERDVWPRVSNLTRDKCSYRLNLRNYKIIWNIKLQKKIANYFSSILFVILKWLAKNKIERINKLKDKKRQNQKNACVLYSTFQQLQSSDDHDQWCSVLHSSLPTFLPSFLP
jgi:hypothetical protein